MKLAVVALIAVASAGAPPSPAEAASWYHARPECLDEEAALSRQGFTRADIRKAAWIAWRESGCGRDLVNERTQDWGHWQFHWAYWRHELCKARIACDRRQLLDLRSSAKAVKYAHQRYGWKPWCYQKCPWQ